MFLLFFSYLFQVQGREIKVVLVSEYFRALLYNWGSVLVLEIVVKNVGIATKYI